MDYERVGEVTHYYNKIGVAVLALSAAITVGDVIHIVGHTTDFCQMVKSLQVDHHAIREGAAGDEVALKVLDRVRAGDRIFRVRGADAVDFLSKRADVSAAVS